MTTPDRNASRMEAVLPSIAIGVRRAGEHLRRFRRSHAGIDLVDYGIAAIAEAYDVPLLTWNTRHFPMFKGLKPAF